MVWFKGKMIYGAILCLFCLSNSMFAADKAEATSSPNLIKQQISQSEKALLDLEQLVQECGDCSEEVRIAGSLTELRQYIAFLRVRLDSIRSEIAQKTPPITEKQVEQPVAEKPVVTEVAPVAAVEPLAATETSLTKIASVHADEAVKPAPTMQESFAEIENAYFELDQKIRSYNRQSQHDAAASANGQAFEQRIDNMYRSIVEMRNSIKEAEAAKATTTTTPAEDVTLVASRNGVFAPKPKEAPAEVTTAPALQPPPAAAAPAQAPAKSVNLSEFNYKIEGRGFFAYRHDATEGDGQSNEFEMARMNFGIRYFASDDLTLRYVTDIARESGTGKIDAQAQLAYVDWKIDKHFNLLTGLLSTNNWAQTEGIWGYRSILWSPTEAFGDYWGTWNKKYTAYLESWAQADPTKAGILSNHVTSSRSKMGASADMAVGVSYKPVKSAFVNFQIRNGSGYKSAENDMFKNFQLMVGKSFMGNAVNVSAFTELEPYRGVDTNGESKGFVNVAWDVSASYAEANKYTVGTSVNSKTFASTESITGTCISVFAHGFVKPNKLKAIVRYDIYNTGFNDAIVRPGDAAFESNGTRMVIGIDFLAHKNFSIIPNLQVVSYEDADLEPVKSAYVHMAFKW